MTPFRRAVLAMLIVLGPWSTLEAAPIEVRLVEGTAHGLLLVRSVSGDIVGHGDFLQAAHSDRVESRLVLRFKDGSLHDETIAFSQQRVFTLLNYRRPAILALHDRKKERCRAPSAYWTLVH